MAHGVSIPNRSWATKNISSVPIGLLTVLAGLSCCLASIALIFLSEIHARMVKIPADLSRAYRQGSLSSLRNEAKPTIVAYQEKQKTFKPVHEFRHLPLRPMTRHMSAATKDLGGHEKKPRPSGKETKRLRLDLLPLDILWNIVDRLPRATDIACLALTRRNMMGIVDDFKLLSRRVNGEDGPGYIQCRLQRDRGESLAYIGRKQLPHGHDCPWWIPGSLMYGRNIPRAIPLRSSEQPGFYLSWCTARLVMIHRIVSPKYGYPPSTLDMDFKIRLLDDEIQFQEVWRARILSVTQELMLMCTRSWKHVRAGDAETLRAYLRAMVIWMCFHEAVRFTHQELHGIGFERGHWLGGCKKCYTDWMVSSQYVHPRTWIFFIVTYHNVGACQSAHDKKWNAMGSRNGLPRTFESGKMKDLWDFDEEEMDKRRSGPGLRF